MPFGPLLKDYATSKKSFTFTGTILSTLLSFSVLILSLFLEVSSHTIWGTIAFNSVFIALYFKKRVKAGISGVELSDDTTSVN